MVQNVPKYPGWADGPYTYPSSGHMYGQSFLCITINLDQVDNIGKLKMCLKCNFFDTTFTFFFNYILLTGRQFQYSIPNIFDFSIPSWAEEQFPNLYDAVVNSKEVQGEPWYLILDIVSNQGVTFTSFAKHINYGQGV